MWTHLSRMKMGVGMRGPGEKQLETDRRLVEKRIRDLKRDLDKILKRKEREVAARSDRMTVSLIGYTQRRQKHAYECADRGERRRRRSALCNARHAHPTVATAWLGDPSC